MGDIADGLINGDFDFYTGEYLGEGYGFPRTHDKSLDWEKKKIKYSNQTRERAVNGVMNFLCNVKGYSTSDAELTIKWYAPEIGIESEIVGEICFGIQKDFKKFKDWFNKK